MRGFTETQHSNGSVLGERFFSMIQKQQKQKNSKTEAAKRRFQTPAYNIGERRKTNDSRNESDY